MSEPQEPTFEQLLGDPHEQFDPRSELRAAILASIQEYADAPPATFTVPPRPAAPEVCRCGLPRGTAVHGNPFGAGHAYEPAPAAPAATAGDGLREDCGHESWSGLMRLLDEHWPDDIFPTKYADDPKRDAGPRIVSLMRLVDKLRAERDDVLAAAARDAERVARVRELADELVDVAKDYRHAAPGSHDDGARNAHAAIAKRIRRALDPS